MTLHLTYCAKNCMLVLLAAAFLVIYYYAKPHSFTGKHQAYYEMTAAANKMKQAQQAIRTEMSRRGIEIDTALDINGTGLIGLEWSGITTTLGNVESKRTSANPDFAALLVKLFKEAGLQKGDTIAANCSSSFPALNLAFIAAADVMGLQPVMVTSIGSSMYGGNREDFTYLDMEQYLYDNNLIQNKTIAYSLGGAGDIGKEFEADVIGRIKERLDGYGLQFLYETSLEKNIENRYAFYMAAAHSDIKAFINIGGNLLSLGAYNDSIDNEKVQLSTLNPINNPDASVGVCCSHKVVAVGFNTLCYDAKRRGIKPSARIKTGLVGKFLQTGMPVFYLLNMKSIAFYYQLPFDPDTLPEIGTAPIYYYHTTQHIWNYVILSMFIAALILHIGHFYSINRP